VRFRVCSLFRYFSNDLMDNLRQGRALRWKVETVGLGVVYGKSTPPRL
jgi:hypothetical protein